MQRFLVALAFAFAFAYFKYIKRSGRGKKSLSGKVGLRPSEEMSCC